MAVASALWDPKLLPRLDVAHIAGKRSSRGVIDWNPTPRKAEEKA